MTDARPDPRSRTADVVRETRETRIRVKLDVDGTGVCRIRTGIGFYDHMLDSFGRHGGFDLEIEASGDLHIDMHHTVEDVGICIGKALTQALGDKAGIRRYGSATVPMDETLVTAEGDYPCT